MTATSVWHPFPGTMAIGVGLLQALQDDIHHLQDVIGYASIPGDPRDGGMPRSTRTLDMSLTRITSILKEPPELDDLHQLLMVVPGVESLSLCLHKRRLTEA
jgi:hypothetical protein